MFAMKLIFVISLVVVFISPQVFAGRIPNRQFLRKLNPKANSNPNPVSIEEAKELIDSRLRSRREAVPSGNMPIIHGNYSFIGDTNRYAIIHYSGSNSLVIILLTYSINDNGNPTTAKLYRSIDYGASFTSILNKLDSTNPAIWNKFFVSPKDNSLIIFTHSFQPKLYYSMDEGATWTTQTFPISSINPRSLLWNPVNDRMALAHDSVGDQLYVTQDLGGSWIKIADYVDLPSDYQWGDPDFDKDSSLVYFNTYDPSDRNRLNFTVSLNTQHLPYNSDSFREFDPQLGRHDDFLLLGPYIYVQKTDSNHMIQLYISYQRQNFKKAMIPSTDPHQNYLVSHINQQQALVVVEHMSGQFNLYLSDVTGVYFSLSLPDIVNENYAIDLELIEGINGTLVANQYVPGQSHGSVRTLVSLDNGGNWEFVRPPTSNEECRPPQCSLHFHMTTSDYARTGVYSQDSAPGIILAHGNTGPDLNEENPDLYISRDGGVTWSLTLRGSWGVTVVDHGGLLVVARDYHNTPSTELQYSCTEGLTWNRFTFSSVGMTVFGVITEPGEHTTTVSLYGLKEGSTRTWDVVTVNFSSIFQSTCSSSDYYGWHPWDDRTDESCILGSSVTIERRNASVCCLIGQDYSRPISFTICPCYEDDFECDYGYMRSGGVTGICVHDNSTFLPGTGCLTGQTSYIVSQGYRKVAGDVCSGGVEYILGPIVKSCCPTTNTEYSCDPSCVSEFATCQPSEDGNVCRCIPGYSGDGLVGSYGCTDIDECSISPCSPHASCTNTLGTYQCTCLPGYVGDGIQCSNMDECLDGSVSSCVSNAICIDNDGSFTCTCKPGYIGDGLVSGYGCSDIDECGSTSSLCTSNASCVNADGSFYCLCPSGYVGDGLATSSGCSAAQVATPPPTSLYVNISPTIAVSIMLALALAATLLFAIIALLYFRRYRQLKIQLRSCNVGSDQITSRLGSIHFRNNPAEQPLTWTNPDDDDDEPLPLT